MKKVQNRREKRWRKLRKGGMKEGKKRSRNMKEEIKTTRHVFCYDGEESV